MYLRTLEICVLKYTNLILQYFFSNPELLWQAALKIDKVKLDLLTNTDVLLMVEKDIRGGMCHSIYQYAKAKDKYMKDYDKNHQNDKNHHFLNIGM